MDRIFPSFVPAVSDAQLIEWYSPMERTGRVSPGVSFNFVSSVDGAAALSGRAGGLGDATDQKVLRLLRRLTDVLVVGAGTIRAEGYAGNLIGPEDAAWRAAHGRSEQPDIAVISGDLRVDPQSAFFTEAPTRPLLFTTARSDAAARAALARVADVVVAGDDTVDPRRVLTELADRGHTRIHSEGGPRLFGAFHDADAIDEVCLTLSANLVGGDSTRILTGAGERLVPLDLVHVLQNDGSLFLRYRVRR